MMMQKSEHSFNPSQIDHMTRTEFGLSPKVFETPGMDYDDLNNSENIGEERESTISAHADGGPRSPSAHAGPFARPPISMRGNFLAHVSAESPSNISPNPSEVISEVSEP